jgi:hypothetical protein
MPFPPARALPSPPCPAEIGAEGIEQDIVATLLLAAAIHMFGFSFLAITARDRLPMSLSVPATIPAASMIPACFSAPAARMCALIICVTAKYAGALLDAAICNLL